LSHNELSEKGVGLFAEAINENQAITDFYITHNNLDGPNGLKLLKSLSNKKQLKSLALNSCKMNLACF